MKIIKWLTRLVLWEVILSINLDILALGVSGLQKNYFLLLTNNPLIILARFSAISLSLWQTRTHAHTHKHTHTHSLFLILEQGHKVLKKVLDKRWSLISGFTLSHVLHIQTRFFTTIILTTCIFQQSKQDLNYFVVEKYTRQGRTKCNCTKRAPQIILQ